MSRKYHIFIGLLFLLPLSLMADDNHWEGEGYMPGPGVLTGDKGEADLLAIFKGETKENADVNDEAAEIKSVVKQKENYESFKAVKEGRAYDAQELQDYKEYQEFKKYQEWKKQQAKK